MLSHFWRKLLPTRFETDASERQVGNIVWYILPAGHAVFGKGGPDLDAWSIDNNLVIIKDGLQRTISRVSLPTCDVFVKRIRANTPRAWARDLMRPSKGRLEFENAVALRKAGIPCVEPLAFGEVDSWWPGDSFVITRALPNVEPGDQFLNQLPPWSPTSERAIRRQVARCLATFLARMHDGGVAHPDPHPGNFLVELPESRVPHFTLLDVHAVRFGKPLTWPESRDNLVLFNRWFQVRATQADRHRFWHTYLARRTTLGKVQPIDAAHMAREVESATDASNRRFWAGRTPRYLGENRQFRCIRHGSVSGHAVRELPDEVIRDWLKEPDAVFAQPGARMLKASRSSTVAQIPFGSGTLIYKRFQLKSWMSLVKNCLRPSPAMRSWLAGHQLLDRQISTARPLAVFHRHKLGCNGTGYIVFETIPNAMDLSTAITGDVGFISSWIEQLARLLRTMHDRDVSHRDLKAANVLLAGASVDPAAASPMLIDLVGVTAGITVTDAIRVRDLARLNASFLHSTAISRTDRLRFLQTYLSHGLRSHREWKQWWKRISLSTEAKVKKNIRSGRPLA